MVRAVASHQCGPGSNPGVDAICRLSLLLVLSLLRVLRFSPLLKNQHFQIPIRSGTHGHVSTSSYELFSDPWVNKLQFTIYNIFFLIFLHSDRILRSCWQKLTAHYAFRNLDLNLKLNSVMEYACPGN